MARAFLSPSNHRRTPRIRALDALHRERTQTAAETAAWIQGLQDWWSLPRRTRRATAVSWLLAWLAVTRGLGGPGAFVA